MNKESMQALWENSQLAAGNVAYIENLFENYLKNPNSIPNEWRDYFDSLPQSEGDVSHADIREYFLQQAKQSPAARTSAAPATAEQHLHEKRQAHVFQLINAYRMHGHHHAKLDPLNQTKRHHMEDLELRAHQLGDAELDLCFSTESNLTKNGSPLREIVSALESTYCGHIGVEYMHITDNEQLKWLQERLESVQGKPRFSAEQQKTILSQLTAAEGLEKYLGSKYVGQKRFGLEGGESLLPLMQQTIASAGKHHVKEIIIGMAHRGRLNVLVNVLGKDPELLFQEFEGKSKQIEGSGDVKYHMGFSSDIATPDGNIHLALSFNPSHLEIISPVVEGSVRARQRRRDDLIKKEKVVPVIIHGDAAFAGQGVVMETFNFSQARGYSTGGSIHIVINNQIGFTTSNPLDARSTLYCTDVAKMVQAPIFHVNGDDPEAVVFAAQLAFDFRMAFKKDVVIDMVCYRRHGHNEADEPSVTQPMMYRTIKALKTVREEYADHLIAANVVTKDDADAMTYDYRDKLDKHESLIEKVHGDYEGKYSIDWTPFEKTEWHEATDTSIDIKKLKKIGSKMQELPEDFSPHPVLKRLWQERNKMLAGELDLNWGAAETLAYASLIDEGYPVRLSGQDCGRGTFAHRHAVLHDYQTGNSIIPVQKLAKTKNQLIIIDSVLSEEAVLAFEYGFAAAEPNALVIWEAQFGDFANGAQVVIDQFISSGWQKWGRLCGLVMFLPHGFEGQGPEHSSARLERYMQLCAQHNMQVCIPTTPAQIFHLIRRQMIRPFRKPLIVMTPKSLLRHKLATSSLEEVANGEFQLIIPEVDKIDPKKTRKVVLCSGKVYYDLLIQRRENKQDDVAIVRIEQMYPFPIKATTKELKKYSNAKEIIWCQEEPQNQGVWFSSAHNIEACLQDKQSLSYVGRGFCASPAVGYASLHMEQQKALVDEALK